MKSQFTIALMLLLVCYGIPRANGQEVLRGYVDSGLANNLSLQQEQLSYQQSIARLREVRSYYMPSLSFNASYTLAQGGRRIAFPLGDLINPMNATLNQLTDSEQFPTNLQNVDEQFLPNDFHDTRLEVQQAIINTDALYGIRAQKAQVSMQEATREAYEMELVRDIRNAYFQYLQAEEAVAVYDHAMEIVTELVRVNERLVANDKATIDLVYRAEMEQSEVKVQQSEAAKARNLARNYFNFLLNRELEEPIEADQAYLLSAVQKQERLSAKADTESPGRAELRAVDFGLQASEALLDQARAYRIPDLGLGLSAGYQGFGYSFDEEQDYALLQLNLSWSLFSGFRNQAKTQQAILARERLQSQRKQLEQQISIEVKDASQSLETAYTTYEARSSAARSAGQTLRLVKRRYEEGLAILVEYLDARNQYTNAQLQEQIAFFQVHISYNNLQFALGQR